MVASGFFQATRLDGNTGTDRFAKGYLIPVLLDLTYGKRSSFTVLPHEFAIMIDFATHQTENGTLVIRLGGRLDHDSNEYFFRCVQDEIENGHRKIVINCSDLGYVSSIGLGALVRARSRVAKAGGTIYLARIESQILDLFRLINFDKLYNIYPTEREAVTAIEAS